jgi:ribosomal protein S18 acetylase RimI-like enzyme
VLDPDGAAHPFDVRLGRSGDADAIGQLLHDFNREFDEPAPSPPELAERIRLLLDSGETAVVLGGAGPDGLAVLRFRLSIWSAGLECYLAELYVVPERRGSGLGRALMQEAIDEARRRGADHMDLGTSETDTAARHLYEALGFSNRENGPSGPIMYVYERDI